MSSICLCLKIDETIHTIEIESELLPSIVTNIRLYEQDPIFINEILNMSNQTDVIPLFHKSDGILVIDFKNKKILDSQGYTGVNKITPEEIYSSMKGNIALETLDNNVVKRFKELVEADRLTGFEEWRDNGTIINKTVLHISSEELIASLDNIRHVGQFVFNTKPFHLITFCETDSTDQIHLLNYLLENNFLSEVEKVMWLDYIAKLKK